MTAPLDTSIKVEQGSGNVFADIGMRNPEVALAKAELAHQIGNILARRDLSQKEAAYILGTQAQHVSNIIRGRLGQYSLERMIRFMNRLGIDVEIRIAPSEAPGLRVVGPENNQ